MNAKKSESEESKIDRAARYILQYKDNTIIRFAAAQSGAKKFQSRVVNLSETGLAFLLPMVDNPKLDDTIKVEFQVPNQEAMACFAKVVRVNQYTMYDHENNKLNLKMVAVNFLDLPVAHRQMIRDGIQQEFEDTRKEYEKEQRSRRIQWALLNLPEALKSFLSSLFNPKK